VIRHGGGTPTPWLWLAALPLLLLPHPLAARQGEPVLVHPRPHDAVVAVAVRFPNGSALDPEGREGTAFLLGRVLEEEGRRSLRSLSATVEAEVARDEFLLLLRAPEEAWDRAWGIVRDLLGGPPLSDEALTRARESQRERLVFEAGAPARAFEAERDRLFLGASHPGARLLRGTPAGLAALSVADLNDFRSRHLRLEESLMAVVGPVTPDQVQGVLRSPIRLVGPDGEPVPDRGGRDPGEQGAPPGPDTLSPPGVDPPADPQAEEDPREAPGEPDPPVVRPLVAPIPAPLHPPDTPAAPPAWQGGDRMVVDQEVTSTWIAVAWPLPAGTPGVLLDFLVHIVAEGLNPSPPDPGLYRAEVRLDRLGPAPLLVVNATVDPRVTGRWEARILQALEIAAEDPPRGAFFELTRRRYRAERLLEQAHPEARARWLVRIRAAEGDVPRLTRQVWALTREGLQGVAGARGEPRILLYGPVRMMEP
jgi:hypothetical protein